MMNFNRFAMQYARNRHVNTPVLKRLIVGGEVDSRSNVLEVGCGTGNYILALQSITNCTAWGADPSAQMIQQARLRLGDVTFIEGIAEQIAMPDNHFDFIFSVDVIHHLESRLRFFNEAYRILKPGGRLCTTTESTWSIRRRQPFSKYFPETVNADLKRYPSISELRRMMASVGFEQTRGETISEEYSLKNTQAYREKAFSCLHLISEEAFRKGLERMESDLKTGPIPGISKYSLLWGIKPCFQEDG